MGLLLGAQQCQACAEHHDVVCELLAVLGGAEVLVVHVRVAEVHGHQVCRECGQACARQACGDEGGQQVAPSAVSAPEMSLPKVAASSLETAGTPVAAICCRKA